VVTVAKAIIRQHWTTTLRQPNQILPVTTFTTGEEMATKIRSLTIVNQEGTREYIVGLVYNGLLIDRISINSIEYPDSISIIYQGYTKENELVFEVINAPINVEYEPE
jgi:hypothetical protein